MQGRIFTYLIPKFANCQALNVVFTHKYFNWYQYLFCILNWTRLRPKYLRKTSYDNYFTEFHLENIKILDFLQI